MLGYWKQQGWKRYVLSGANMITQMMHDSGWKLVRRNGSELVNDCLVAITDCREGRGPHVVKHYPSRGFMLDIEWWNSVPPNCGVVVHRERWYATRREAARAAALAMSVIGQITPQEFEQLKEQYEGRMS